MPAVHRTERAGVPVLWSEGAGSCEGGVVFRTGAADETMARRGITTLVTRVALRRLGAREYEAGAVVRPGWTMLFAGGEPAEVAGFLEGICASLADLPLDRVEHELRILAVEGVGWGPSVEQDARHWRFGTTGYGLDAVAEAGLEWLGPDEVGAWAAERFVAGNACAWMTAAPPDDLLLRLPPGRRVPAPPVRPVGHTFPVETIAEVGGNVGLSTLGDRLPARDAAHQIAARRGQLRLRDELGIAARVWLDGDVLDGHDEHAIVCADCLDLDAETVRGELLDIFESLATDGPDDRELAWWRRNRRRELAEPTAAESALVISAVELLLGAPSTTTTESEEALRAVTAPMVAAAMRDALTTLIILVPESVIGRAADGSHPPQGDDELVEGVTLTPTSAWADRLTAERLVAGADGISVVHDGDYVVSVRYADCVAVSELPSGILALSGIGAAHVVLNPWAYEDGHAVAEQVKSVLAAELLPPLGPGGQSVRAAALEQLRHHRGDDPGALDMLWGLMVPGERVERLALAATEDRRGVVALTNRRITFCAEDDVVFDQPRAGASARTDWRDGDEHLVLDTGVYELACRDVVPASQVDRFVDDL